MHQQTPLGSHPDIPRNSDKVPFLLHLVAIIMPGIVLAFSTLELISRGEISILKIGLLGIGMSLYPILDTLYNWRSKSLLGRIFQVSLLIFMVGASLHFIFKP